MREHKEEFVLKEEHLKLLKNANIDWDDCEFGAPCIDPKRPFGNSYVIGDIAEILGIKSTDPDDDSNFEDQEEELFDLYKELQTALQVILITQSFKLGKYVKEDRYDYQSWKYVG